MLTPSPRLPSNPPCVCELPTAFVPGYLSVFDVDADGFEPDEAPTTDHVPAPIVSRTASLESMLASQQVRSWTQQLRRERYGS